jgi:hypothetical protein
MIRKYRNSFLLIEAVQFNGFTDGANYLPEDLVELFGIKTDVSYPVTSNENGNLVIHLLKKDIMVKVGDYIIKDASGNYDVCTERIFNIMYEPAIKRKK